MKLDISSRGQVFTPQNIVDYMVSLIKNEGTILEPSCGNGAFLKKLPNNNLTAIEIQENLSSGFDHLNIDFFDFYSRQKYDTIIGNPPYVKHKDIELITKNKLDYTLFDKRTNLYLFFINKCIDLLQTHGELIFITPRDFLKQTSAINLNQKLFELGSFTHFHDLGDKIIFKGYAPNCVIWRWQKGLKTNKLDNGTYMDCMKGQIIFTQKEKGKILSDLFEIKVGAVSGADDIFEQENNHKSTEFVCSATFKTGRLKKMIYNIRDKSLKEHKTKLMNRRIKKFTEDNWWEWGRKYADRTGKRIYVNCKTRNKNPFFVSDVSAYDGSILALFPKRNTKNINKLCEILNDTDWTKYGFICGGRYVFSQRSLENVSLNKI